MDFEYERLPSVCYKCERVRHDDTHYRENINKKDGKEKESPVEPWIIAQQIG